MVIAKFSTNSPISVRNAYKYDGCHNFYDAWHDGDISFRKVFFTQSLTPTRQHTRQIEEDRMRAASAISRSPTRNQDFVEMLRTLDNECRDCNPLSPLQCVTRCNVWKLKNELRTLHEIMDNPHFMKNLFNVLKNGTRLEILNVIVKSRHSVSQLQKELKKTGYTYSQDTITREYLLPLIQVGLASKASNQYHATIFGGRISELLDVFPEIASVLPAHSECYEEALISSLSDGPKTFQEMKSFISPKVASRVLKRLKTSELIETSKERDYVFFFKSKRDPRKETLAVTERKVYMNIPEEGISAKKLANKTELSIRRIYKCLRGLKGKKLVFARKNPRIYSLTAKGAKLAALLQNLQNLVKETWNSSEQVVKLDDS
jgi:DNA-binding HxlR family transcriptional regulator